MSNKKPKKKDLIRTQLAACYRELQSYGLFQQWIRGFGPSAKDFKGDLDDPFEPYLVARQAEKPADS